MGALTAYVYVHNVCAWYSQMSEEDKPFLPEVDFVRISYHSNRNATRIEILGF